jgi:hypothetical protein
MYKEVMLDFSPTEKMRKSAKPDFNVYLPALRKTWCRVINDPVQTNNRRELLITRNSKLRFASLPYFVPLDIVKQIPRIALQIPDPKSSTYASLHRQHVSQLGFLSGGLFHLFMRGTLSRIQVLEAPLNGIFFLSCPNP